MTRLHALKAVTLFLVVGGIAQAQVGPFRPLAFGVQLDYSVAINPDTVALTAADGTPQGRPQDSLYGVGVTGQWRIGEVFWKARDLVLQTSVGVRYNHQSDDATVASYKAVIGSTPTTLTDVTWNRKTRLQEFYFMAPLRWYPGQSGDLEGFFLEGGPGWVRMDMKADISLKGTVGGGPVVVNDSASYVQNKMLWTVNIGYTRAMRDSLISYAIGVDKVVKAGNLGGTTGKFSIQYQF